MSPPPVLPRVPGFEPPKPNLVDRVVGFFDPAAGLQRYKARMGLALSEAYAGARSDSPATKDWRVSRGSVDEETVPVLNTLQGRSRDLVRNNPLAAGAALNEETHAVGTGLWPLPQIDRDLLGLSDEEADEWEEAADRVWAAWAETTNCDVTGRQTFAAMQATIRRSQTESGDVFLIRRFKERPGMLFGTCFQLVESDRVATPLDLQSDPKVVAGVEGDDDGAPAAYYVFDRHPADEWLPSSGYQRVPAFDPVTGFWRVRHVYDLLRPGQTRGIPAFAPVMEQLRNLGLFVNASVDAAVLDSLMTAFVQTSLPPEDEEETGLTIGELTKEEVAAAAAAERGEIKLGRGNVVELAEGETVNIAESKRPSPQFEAFVRASVQWIASATGQPYEVLIGHFQASYSAARAALLQFWRRVYVQRHRHVESYLNPVREAVLAEAIARGYLRAPGFDRNPFLRRAWLECSWIGDAPGMLDPIKEAKAAQVMIAETLATREGETLRLNGGDFRRNVRQRRREEKLRQAAGLLVPVAPDPEGDALAAEEEEGK